MTTVDESLARHMTWLHIEDCPCPFGWVSMGRLYGVSLGKGWGRLSTTRGCRHHDLCSKAMKAPDLPQRPEWYGRPWCHRVRGHDGACSEVYDAMHGKGSSQP